MSTIAIMVPDSPDVREVLTAEDGVFGSARPGTLIIDFSSIRPDVTVELAKEAKEKGFRILDAPVSGGEVGAVNAALSIMVGGEAADFDEAKEIFDAVGKTIVHVGPNGSGQRVKAANQLIVAGNIQLLAEAIVFLEAFGVDVAAAVEVLLRQSQRAFDMDYQVSLAFDNISSPELDGYGVDHVKVAEGLGCKAIRVHDPEELAEAFARATSMAQEFRVPVVVEVILERVTNIAMGVELGGVNAFEALAISSADAPTAIALLD